MSKEQTILVSVNPTLTGKNFNEIRTVQEEFVKRIAKAQSDIMEVYLKEYCEVNAIEENELKNHLQVIHRPEGIFVTALGSEEDVEFGIRYVDSIDLNEKKNIVKLTQFFTVVGKFLTENKWQKTEEFLRNFNSK